MNYAVLAPLADKSGIKCALGQNGDVWFLAGTLGGPVVRTCTIPAGKAMLFPVINVKCSNAEFPQYKSELELRKCAISQQDLTEPKGIS